MHQADAPWQLWPASMATAAGDAGVLCWAGPLGAAVPDVFPKHQKAVRIMAVAGNQRAGQELSDLDWSISRSFQKSSARQGSKQDQGLQ